MRAIFKSILLEKLVDLLYTKGRNEQLNLGENIIISIGFPDYEKLVVNSIEQKFGESVMLN